MVRRMFLNKNELSEVRQIIEERTGYQVKSKITLNQIFIRSSFAAETGQNSNEIFEFIGDEVLGFYVVKIISKKIGSLNLVNGYNFRIKENQFTEIKHSLVNNETLSKIIDEWDIARFMLLGKSDIKNHVEEQTKVKADLFEAIIGAIAIESDWDSQILENVILNALNIDTEINKMIENDLKSKNVDVDINNSVTLLKELAESGQCTMPKYDFLGSVDIIKNGEKKIKWVCNCSIINDKTNPLRQVWASSKKDAKKAAAYLVLCEHLDIQNKYGPNDWFNIWNYDNGKLSPARQLNSEEE